MGLLGNGEWNLVKTGKLNLDKLAEGTEKNVLYNIIETPIRFNSNKGYVSKKEVKKFLKENEK